MPTTIIIYNGHGTAEASCSDMQVFFEQYVQQKCDESLKVFSTKFEDHSRLENIMQEQGKKIFVIPGGNTKSIGMALKQDNDIVERLKDDNDPIPDAYFAMNIKDWVAHGKAQYFGPCAGANLAGKFLECYSFKPEYKDNDVYNKFYYSEDKPSYQVAETFYSDFPQYENDCLLNLCDEFTPVANYYNHYLINGQKQDKHFTPYSIQCNFTADFDNTNTGTSFNYLYLIGTGFVPRNHSNIKSEFKVGANYKRNTNNPYRFFDSGSKVRDDIEDLAAVIYRPASETKGGVCLTGFHPEASIKNSALLKTVTDENNRMLTPLDDDALKQLESSREQSCNKAVEMVKTTFKI